MKCFKFIIIAGAVFAAVIPLAGCALKNTTKITEFDKDGKITKVTETQESVVDQIITSTQNKTCLITREAYIVGFQATPGSEATSSVFTLQCVYAHKNTGLLTLMPNQQGIQYFPEIIRALKNMDSVALSGIGISSGNTTAAPGKEKESETKVQTEKAGTGKVDSGIN